MDAPPTDDSRLLRLHATDNVCAAATALEVGEVLQTREGLLTVRSSIAVGHKIAVQDIPSGCKVRKYGAIIGSATLDILAGDHVHTHNLASDYIPTFARGEHERTPTPVAAPGGRR